MSVVSIKTFAKRALFKPPHFEPRYNEKTVHFYLNKFMKSQTVQYLSETVVNYDEIDLNTLKVNEIEDLITRNIVKQDIINVLDDAIVKVFYNPIEEEILSAEYNLSMDEEFDKYIEDGPYNDNAKKRLQNELCKRFNELVYRRTTNSTRFWGFTPIR